MDSSCKEDVPFEFKDTDYPTDVENKVAFAPLNLSKFPGHSDELPEIFWFPFDCSRGKAGDHVQWFITMAEENHVKKEESLYMRTFIHHLGGKPLAWFVGLEKVTISSFVELIEAFWTHWDPKHRDRWMPYVEDAKKLFSGEIHEDKSLDVLLEETIIQDQENEVITEGEEQEAPVEETEECTEMVSAPYSQVTVCYDMLALLEESYRYAEDDDYWKFIGLPMYDSSRPCSIVVDPLPSVYMDREACSLPDEEWINPFSLLKGTTVQDVIPVDNALVQSLSSISQPHSTKGIQASALFFEHR